MFPYDWYWVVNNDTTKFYSSKVEDYVESIPSDWLVTNEKPSYIKSEQELTEVLTSYKIKGPVSITPSSVTPYQARLALKQAGLLETVEQAVSVSDDTAKIAWEYAISFERNSPFINSIGSNLNLTTQEIDDLFILANSFNN